MIVPNNTNQSNYIPLYPTLESLNLVRMLI